MSVKSVVRSLLKLTTVVSLIISIIGVASLFILASKNNPFIMVEDETAGLYAVFPLFVSGGIFIASLLALFLIDLTGWLLNLGKDGKDTSHSTDVNHGEAVPNGGSKDPEEVYLTKFRKSNFYIGGLLAGLVGSTVATQALVEGGTVSNQLVNIIYGLLRFAVQIFGGFTGLTVAAAVFLGVWYGLKNEATEALLAGIGAWAVIGIVGLGFVSSNASGFGLVIAGLYGVYYGVRARGSTETIYLEDSLANDF